MTIQEAIAAAESIYPGLYDREWMLRHLSELEGGLNLRLGVFEGFEERTDLPYTSDSDTGRVLIVPFPFDRVYVLYLKAQMEFYNDDIDKYENSQAMYERELDEFLTHYARTHKHKRIVPKYI